MQTEGISTKRMQALELLERKQEETGRRINRLLDIFEETGLVETRNGKKALADEGMSIYAQHSSDKWDILDAHLTDDEAKRLFNKGWAILKEAGFGKPLSLIAVVAVPYQRLRIEQADDALAAITKSRHFTEEEKKIAKVTAEEISLSIENGVLKKAIRDYRLTRILHPALRRSRKREEERKIDEAISEFETEDAKLAPQWYEIINP
ncbi:MAG: hypothetical protein KGI04_00345 [Candidatus Micrarchaeota archaeon]|nr:hypothetical protein [Candidatus Micrarchaeota archaeon]